MSIRSLVVFLALAAFAKWGNGQLEICKNFISTLDFDTVQVGNKKMVYFAQEKTFDEALAACEKIGMRLVTIASEEENAALFKFLHNRVWGAKTSYDWTYWYIWSSGKQVEGSHYFKWLSTGQNVTYTSWIEGEPSFSPGYDGSLEPSCIELRYINHDKLLWNDSLCYIKKKYICELDHKDDLSHSK